MPKKLIEQCCVRISIYEKEECGTIDTNIDVNDNLEKEPINLGTGIIVKNNDKYFVLTAEHCIYNKNKQIANTTNDIILIEYQEDYNSIFTPIEIVEITEANKQYDWALIEIKKPSIDCDFMKIGFGNNFIADETVHIRGYQSFYPLESRPWEGKIINTAENEFVINITGQSFEQGGELGAKLAKGLSGSGVYIIRAKRIYLIGHLKQVIGNIALNNDIKCCSLNNLTHIIGADKWTDIGAIVELLSWESEVTELVAEEDVEKWIKDNDRYFNNLLRKSQVLYSDKKAEQETRERIIEFLNEEYNNNEIRKYSDLINKFEETSLIFERSVKREYTREVDDRNEAKDLLLKLQKDFAEHIKELINDKSNKQNMALAQHKVTWWLMNCSFDFRE